MALRPHVREDRMAVELLHGPLRIRGVERMAAAKALLVAMVGDVLDRP